MFAHNYLFILALALEFARCPYRILQINYVDVDVFEENCVVGS